MSQRHYEIGSHESFPTLQPHSEAKHEVLRAYLQHYFDTLTLNPRRDTLRLTLVDGFAGYGHYNNHISKMVSGSPFIMLEEAVSAETRLNCARDKKIAVDISFVFVEKKKDVFLFLKTALESSCYKALIDTKKIYLLNSSFQKAAPQIIQHILNKTPKSGRSVFLLDQYGYAQVDTHLVKTILHTLPSSEVILTFNVDSFLNFVNDDNKAKILGNIGLQSIPAMLQNRSIENIKQNEADWRLFIQSALYPNLVSACGAKFYTLFFIRSEKGHGNYWLLHLSNHPTARDVMAQVHWDHSNYFIHYGEPGLNTFQVPVYSTRKANRLFGFDREAKEDSKDMMLDQIPEIIRNIDRSVTFADLYASTCNTTPAVAAMYKEALSLLASENYLEIRSKDGSIRKSSRSISSKDTISIPNQRRFVFLR